MIRHLRVLACELLSDLPKEVARPFLAELERVTQEVLSQEQVNSRLQVRLFELEGELRDTGRQCRKAAVQRRRTEGRLGRARSVPGAGVQATAQRLALWQQHRQGRSKTIHKQ
jgi:hypothetical protein